MRAGAALCDGTAQEARQAERHESLGLHRREADPRQEDRRAVVDIQDPLRRLELARLEIVDACDGFLAREAIRASLTADERRAFAELLPTRAQAIENVTGMRPEVSGVLTRSQGSFEEIVRLARLFVQLGVRKLRLTGGERSLCPL